MSEDQKDIQTNKEGSNSNHRRIFSLPPDILNRIEELLDQGWRAKFILKTLHSEFGSRPGIKLPSLSSISKYILYYFKNKGEEGTDSKVEKNEALYEIKQDIQVASDIVKSSDKSKIDKRLILEGIIKKSIDRIQAVEKFQRGRVSPSLESCITKYLQVLRESIETLNRYNDEMPTDDTIIALVVEENVQALLRSFHKVIQELAPEKMLDFQRRLKEEFALQKSEKNQLTENIKIQKEEEISHE